MILKFWNGERGGWIGGILSQENEPILKGYLSANDAKHLRAPSDTDESSCWSRVERDSTQAARQLSWGSILEHNLENI